MKLLRRLFCLALFLTGPGLLAGPPIQGVPETLLIGIGMFLPFATALIFWHWEGLCVDDVPVPFWEDDDDRRRNDWDDAEDSISAML
jgi:hypothetical protein